MPKNQQPADRHGTPAAPEDPDPRPDPQAGPPPAAPPPKPRAAPFTPEESRAALAAAARDPLFRDYLRFALLTGMRRAEILCLTWHDVDLWDRLEIRVADPRTPKSRAPDSRRIAIGEELLGVLLDLRSPRRWVFQKSGSRILSGTVALFFGELSGELGFPVTQPRIRSTFAQRAHDSILPASDGDWDRLRALLGHRDIKTTQAYFRRPLRG